MYSVRIVDPEKMVMIRLSGPAMAQKNGVPVVMALQRYSSVQMVCSAAKAGWRE